MSSYLILLPDVALSGLGFENFEPSERVFDLAPIQSVSDAAFGWGSGVRPRSTFPIWSMLTVRG